MANTYTKIHIHFVFAVRCRRPLITEGVRERVEKFITGIVQCLGHKMLSIYCMPDHVHIFVGFRPSQSMSDLMKEVKSKSTDFINREGLVEGKFQWQEGYGAFSHSEWESARVIHYILNQESHHRKIAFEREYKALLKKFDVSYDEKYLFG